MVLLLCFCTVYLIIWSIVCTMQCTYWFHHLTCAVVLDLVISWHIISWHVQKYKIICLISWNVTKYISVLNLLISWRIYQLHSWWAFWRLFSLEVLHSQTHHWKFSMYIYIVQQTNENKQVGRLHNLKSNKLILGINVLKFRQN